jgi:iron complex transport system substrate-binding protein
MAGSTTPITPDTPPTSEAPTAATDQAIAASAFPISVTHALGTTEILEEPQRVIALDRSTIDAALALGLDVVGYTTYSDPDGALPEYFGDALDEHAADAVWVGDLLSPNLEAIAALEPDLILTAAVRHEGIYDELSGIAATVATESAGGGWKDGFTLVAEATGRLDLAEELLTDYEECAASVGADINAAAENPTISVVRFADAIRLYQPVSFSGTVLDDADLARPDSQQDREEFIRIISEEELALADADVLLFTVPRNDAVEENATAIQSRPLWSTLAAVQAGNAHAVADDSWMSGVGLYGAQLILDDLASIFDVDPHR